jgi:hypothetical protein
MALYVFGFDFIREFREELKAESFEDCEYIEVVPNVIEKITHRKKMHRKDVAILGSK